MGAYVQRRDRRLLQKRHDSVAELRPLIRERVDDRDGREDRPARRAATLHFGASVGHAKGKDDKPVARA